MSAKSGEALTPNSNECNSTLTSGTRIFTPTPTDVNDRVTGYEFARRADERRIQNSDTSKIPLIPNCVNNRTSTVLL